MLLPGVGVDGSGDFGLVMPSAETADVSGRLGPLLAKVFQNHEGVNLVALFSKGRVMLELRELLPTSVAEAAGDEMDVFERAE